MDGFTVEISALIKVGAKYGAVSRRLEEDAVLLKNNLLMLKSQTLADNVVRACTEAANALEAAALETREIGAKCTEIAYVYDNTEKRVNNLISALSAESVNSLLSSQNKSQNAGDTRVFVDSPFRTAKPIIFTGNNFLCEGWVFERAITAAMEGDF